MIFRCFLDLWLNHTHKHKYNSKKHKTPIFTWFTTSEVATSIGTLSLLYAVKGIQSTYYALLHSLSFSLLRASTHKTATTLSSLSLLLLIHLPIRYAEHNADARIDAFPFTIYSSFVEWLRSLRLHLCGPKAPYPKNSLKNSPKPLKNGVKTLLVFGFTTMFTTLRLSSSATSPKILGHFLKTAQLSRRCYPTPIGPQHSLVAHSQATCCFTLLLILALLDDLVCLIIPLGVDILQFVVRTFHFCDASFDLLQRLFCNLFFQQFTHCSLCFLKLHKLSLYLLCQVF